MKLNAIIIDDEPNCSDVLKWQVESYCTEVNILREVNQAEEAVNVISELKPDVVFLDIEMPRLSGFELLNLIKPIDFHLIFTTAYNSFALKAFKENAIDYLLKPIEKNDLINAVEKIKRLNKNAEHANYSELINGISKQLLLQKRIALPTNDGVRFIEVDQIIRVEGDNNYSFVFLENGDKICISKTLKQIEDKLQGFTFYRVHQSHLINMNHIEKMVKDDGGYLVMSDKSTITIARNKKSTFLNFFSKL